MSFLDKQTKQKLRKPMAVTGWGGAALFNCFTTGLNLRNLVEAPNDLSALLLCMTAITAAYCGKQTIKVFKTPASDFTQKQR